jgi:D-alanine-D-alanine ligase
MKQKLHIGILFGGKSTEHEISLRSAQSLIQAINKNKYDISLIGIDQHGKWYLHKGNHVAIDRAQAPLALFPGQDSDSAKLMPYPRQSSNPTEKIDVIFPVLHGTYGEDGSVQGLLKLIDIPFVGAGVLGSAIGMDKDVMKRLLRDAGINIPKFLVFHRNEKSTISFDQVKGELGLPCFVKPANTGSSVGISKARNLAEFEAAIEEAFSYDHKIVIEEFISGREMECSVLGNDQPIASIVGEIIPRHEFYSYAAKYLDENGAKLEIPADIPSEAMNALRATAVNVFKILCCQGMARVDFFLREDGEIFVNEINTIPGFTSISMYPRLWEASGLSYEGLVDRLVQLAMEQFEQDKKINTQFALPKA